MTFICKCFRCCFDLSFFVGICRFGRTARQDRSKRSILSFYRFVAFCPIVAAARSKNQGQRFKLAGMPALTYIKTQTENFLPVRTHVSSYHIISYHIISYHIISRIMVGFPPLSSRIYISLQFAVLERLPKHFFISLNLSQCFARGLNAFLSCFADCLNKGHAFTVFMIFEYVGWGFTPTNFSKKTKIFR